MQSGYLVDTLNWVVYAIRQQNYIGAEAVINDILNRLETSEPENKNHIASLILTESLKTNHLNMLELAEKTDLSVSEAKQLVAGDLFIDERLATKLGKIFGLPASIFRRNKDDRISCRPRVEFSFRTL